MTIEEFEEIGIPRETVERISEILPTEEFEGFAREARVVLAKKRLDDIVNRILGDSEC